MKRYKLKKDLPTFKVGDEFYLDSANDLRFKGSDITAYNDKTLEKFPNILKDWFEEIPEKYKRWRAEYGDPYYHINSFGGIQDSYDRREGKDDYRYDTGIYGRTKEELEAKLEYDIARQTLLDDAEGGKWIKHEENWSCYCGHCSGYDVEYCSELFVPGVIYFKSKDALKKSLEEHKEQWEIVRKYEMGEIND